MPTRKWKNEFLVNTTTTGIQEQSSVTALADGGFVITWRDDGPVDSLVRWQRYDAAGAKLGTEQTIALTDGGDQSLPDVVQLNDGNLWFIAKDFDGPTDDVRHIRPVPVDRPAPGKRQRDERDIEAGGKREQQQCAAAHAPAQVMRLLHRGVHRPAVDQCSGPRASTASSGGSSQVW